MQIQPSDKPRLWIFGDSWSALDPKDINKRTWMCQVSEQLSQHIGVTVEMINSSLVGSSQDWLLNAYLKVADDIAPNDYVVLVLTSPDRYWFFEDLPSLSNINILDAEKELPKHRLAAVEGFVKHIDRPHLHLLHGTSRLALIAYTTRLRGLRRPLIVPGFDQILEHLAEWPDLSICNGYLTAAQYDEYKQPEELAKLVTDRNVSYFNGYDCRYNHLCLTNHDILANKISQALITNTPADLTTDFEKDLISREWYNDTEFCNSQLKPASVEAFNSYYKTHKPGIMWRKKMRL